MALPIVPETVRPFADLWDDNFQSYRTDIDDDSNGLGQASDDEIEQYYCVDCGCFFCTCDIDTTVYKMKLPLGLNLFTRVAESAGRDNCEKKEGPGGVRNEMEYGKYPFNQSSYLFNNEVVGGYPMKLTEEVATLCAGGSQLGKDQYLNTETKRMNEVDFSYSLLNNPIWNETGASTECSLYFNDAEKTNNVGACYNALGDNCNDGFYTVAADFPTLCQMGDYIETVDECIDRCDGATKPNINNPNYCHFAKDRICSKQRVPYHDPTKESLKYVNIVKRGTGIQNRNRSIIMGYKDRVLAFYS
jgi:hypothetical protein